MKIRARYISSRFSTQGIYRYLGFSCTPRRKEVGRQKTEIKSFIYFISCLVFFGTLQPYPLVNEHSNGISPSLIGTTSSKGPFSIAMLDYRSVMPFWCVNMPRENMGNHFQQVTKKCIGRMDRYPTHHRGVVVLGGLKINNKETYLSETTHTHSNLFIIL